MLFQWLLRNYIFSDSDKDFDPGAEIYKNDDDDERTLEEEEAMSATSSCANELDDLQNVNL